MRQLQKELWLHRGEPAGARLHHAAPHTYRELSPAFSRRTRSPSACLHHDTCDDMLCVRARQRPMLAGASFDELDASYDLDDGERWLTNYYFLSLPPYPPQVRCSTEVRCPTGGARALPA